MDSAKLHWDWELLPRSVDFLVFNPVLIASLKLHIEIPEDLAEDEPYHIVGHPEAGLLVCPPSREIRHQLTFCPGNHEVRMKTVAPRLSGPQRRLLQTQEAIAPG